MTFDKLLRVKTAKGAPHKPLLLLSAFECYRNGSERLIPFRTLEAKFNGLAAMSDRTTKVRIQEPFTRLQQDGVWEITTDSPQTAETTPLSGGGKASQKGGLTEEAFDASLSETWPKAMSRVIDHYFDPDVQTKLRRHLNL